MKEKISKENLLRRVEFLNAIMPLLQEYLAFEEQENDFVFLKMCLYAHKSDCLHVDLRDSEGSLLDLQFISETSL